MTREEGAAPCHFCGLRRPGMVPLPALGQDIHACPGCARFLPAAREAQRVRPDDR